MSTFNIIGLMSGTSLDGLDIAYVQFRKSQNNDWSYDVIHTQTVEYDKELSERITAVANGSAWEFIQLDHELAVNWSKSVNLFIKEHQIKQDEIDAIASHGQTIFHRPEIGITTQIGCGQTLATLTGLQVVNDFRTKDVLHGGNGAPLVPIGEKLLFSKSGDAFINIGGFTNITLLKPQIRAFDICPGNLPLNFLAEQLGSKFDLNGDFARAGSLDQELLDKLNKLSYYEQTGPKSLGTEWLGAVFTPSLSGIAPSTGLHTVVEHIAIQIDRVIKKSDVSELFVTGGGALNSYLIERIKHRTSKRIIIPERVVVEFKEAIIFAFLGALNLDGSPNCLSSVTGADTDVVGGIRYSP